LNRRLIDKAEALLAKERGTVFKEPGGRISVCLAYPNTYHVGMSNLGFQGLYGLLNSRADVVCERVFLPDERDISEYLRTATPLFSFETKRPLADFDIIAFSVPYENDYPNIVAMLDLGKVPRHAADRTARHPLLLAGGVCMSFNPEPVAVLFDVIFVGEAEEALDEFIAACSPVRDRQKLFRTLAAGEGFYIPSLYGITRLPDSRTFKRTALDNAPEMIRRRVVADLSKTPLTTSIVTSETEFSNMYLLELMRGCPWRCRFCLVGHLYNPVRKKSVEQVKAEIGRGKGVAAKIGMIGPSLSDYPGIKEILCIEDVQFSITSLRANARSAELVELMKGYRSISIAPEAGTERLRQVINKRVTEPDILATSRLLLDGGVETLRLYFMVGLPTETDEDAQGIIDLARAIRGLSKTGAISLTLSTFVPKPFTPFQWHPMEQPQIVKRRILHIKRSLEQTGGIKVLHDVPKYAYLQGLLARGGRQHLPLIEQLARMVLSGDNLRFKPEEWADDLFRERGCDEALPWDFIDVGVSRTHLWEEYRKAVS
jgi:radical SAM superfamily enzyme YgiQ (UPF0313 family)